MVAEITAGEQGHPLRPALSGTSVGSPRRQRWVVGEPKIVAGHRTVILSPPRSPQYRRNTWRRMHAPRSPDALLFGTSTGYLARSNWDSTFPRAADAIGLASRPAARAAPTPEHVGRDYQCNHQGAHAPTGALLPADALVHQHAPDDRDVEIARALDAHLAEPRSE
jgi:hypothetical protein